VSSVAARPTRAALAAPSAPLLWCHGKERTAMQCDRCGAIQDNGAGYCRVCAAPLNRLGQPRLATTPTRAAPPSRRTRWLTVVALAAVGVLVAACLVLAALSFGLSSLIRWA
jgi:hypothetical protein